MMGHQICDKNVFQNRDNQCLCKPLDLKVLANNNYSENSTFLPQRRISENVSIGILISLFFSFCFSVVANLSLVPDYLYSWCGFLSGQCLLFSGHCWSLCPIFKRMVTSDSRKFWISIMILSQRKSFYFWCSITE